MKKINFPVLVVIIFSLTACYTTGRFKVIEIEVFEPASTVFSPKNRIAAAVYNNSNFRMNLKNSAYVFNEEIYADTLNFDSIASLSYYDNFILKLRGLNHYDTVYDLGKIFPAVGDSALRFFSLDECDSLLGGKQADVLYSLNFFFAFDKISADKFEFYNTMAINTGIIWSIYDFNNSEKLISLLKRDTVYFNSDIGSTTLTKLLNDRPMLISEAASTAGENFACYVIPHWSKTERLMYLSGNIEMIEAEKFAIKNEWLKAAEIWKKNTKSTNLNIAAKSMFNLAVVCEMQGELDAAIDWVIKSINVFGQKNQQHSQNCRDYINTLARRKIDFRKLKEQFDG